MADETSMALDELLRKAQMSDDVDFLREGVRTLAQALMEVEVTQHVGASRYERTCRADGRTQWAPRATVGHAGGQHRLRVPRVRDGSYFPSLLEPRRRAERALVAVVQEAYVQGVSTRRVDDLVQALGLTGHQQEPGLAALRRAGRGGRALPQSPAGGDDLSLRLAGCDLHQGAASRPSRGAGGRDRHWAQRGERAARGAGAGRRAERGWRLLAGLPARLGGARPGGRAARGQRRP